MKNDDDKLRNLLSVINKNKEHLEPWLRPSIIYFRNFVESIEDLKRHFNKNMCYIISQNKNIIGCIDFSKLNIDEKKLSFRIINYWIDKNYARKGIMFKCLGKLEKIFMDYELDYILARIEEINEPSINLIKKLGFMEDSIIGFYVDEDAGKSVDIIEFKKTYRKNMEHEIKYGLYKQSIYLTVEKNSGHNNLRMI